MHRREYGVKKVCNSVERILLVPVSLLLVYLTTTFCSRSFDSPLYYTLLNSGTLQERWYAIGTIVQVSIKDLDITLIREQARIKKSPSTA